MPFVTWLAMPENYWSVATFLLGVWVVYVVRSDDVCRRWGALAERAIFCALTALAVAGFRWPAFAFPVSFNPDEARLGAQALKAMIAPWPWQGFDGGTSGPFNTYLLALPLLLGSHMSFFWIHLIPALLGVAIVLVFALAAEAVAGFRAGRAASVVPLAFFALMTDGDFLHYSSELLPLLLIAIALAVLAFARAGRARGWMYGLAGACLGLVPFTKLQAAPLAFYLVLLFAALLAAEAAPLAPKLRRAASLLGAIAATALLVVASTAATGSLHDAFVSYVANNLAYGAEGHGWQGPHFLLAATPDYEPYAICVLVLIAVCGAAAVRAKPRRDETVNLAAALGFLAVTVYCIEAARRGFPHYLTFASVAEGIVVAVLLGIASRAGVPVASGAVRSSAPVLAAVAILVVPTLATHIVQGHHVLKDVSTQLVPGYPLVNELRTMVRPGDTITVWGWMPELYVYTNARMATKDADDYDEIVPGSYQAYFRERYMTELIAHPPSVFVDAVAPGSFVFKDRAAYGFETFPELRDYVAKNYFLAMDVDGVRIFRRRS